MDCGGARISGALPSAEDIFRTAPWTWTYYSSPKPKVTDAPMFHLLLKAPNKYLPDLTQWVMTEHQAWQIMLPENFKLHIFDAVSGTDVGWARKTPLPWTMSLACETAAASIMQCGGSGEPKRFLHSEIKQTHGWENGHILLMHLTLTSFPWKSHIYGDNMQLEGGPKRPMPRHGLNVLHCRTNVNSCEHRYKYLTSPHVQTEGL